MKKRSKKHFQLHRLISLKLFSQIAKNRKERRLFNSDPSAGEWVTVAQIKDNYKRLVKLSLDPVQTDAVRIVVEKTWGAEKSHIFAFDVK